MTTRLIANKYREGKAKRTLKRELKVLEIVKGEANIAVEFARLWIVSKRMIISACQGNRTRRLYSGCWECLREWVGSANLGLRGKAI
jgi:hypothetical protein